jgi:PKD repeat protein
MRRGHRIFSGRGADVLRGRFAGRVGLLLLLLGGVALSGPGAAAQIPGPIPLAPAPQRTVVSLAAAPSSAPAGQSIDFTGQVRSSPPGAITTRATIDFGDGQRVPPLVTGAGFIAQHTYAAPGTYTATLSVTDSTGRTAQAATRVTVTPATGPFVMTLSAAPLAALVGQSIDFTGRLIASPPGVTPTGATLDFGDGQRTTPVATREGIFAQHAYARSGIYRATLTVTGTGGVTGRVTQTVVVSAPGVPWP